MSHISVEDLAAYALGQLAISKAGAIEAHLKECPDCIDVVLMHRELRDLELLGTESTTDRAAQTPARGVKPTPGGVLGALGGLSALLGLGALRHSGAPSLAASDAQSSLRDSGSHDSLGYEHHESHADHADGASMTATAQDQFNDAQTTFGTPAIDGKSSYVHQHYADTCAVQCQRLILNQFGVGVSEEQLMQEASDHHLYTPGEGTSLESVGNLLELHGVGVHRETNANVFNLANELAQGHKVIVGVESGDLWHSNSVLQEISDWFGVGEADHAVIVSGIDTSDPNDVKVIVTDPGTGDVAKEYSMADFLGAWKGSHFALVATSDPAPATNPEMVNFDYSQGHIDHIGAMPYDVAHDMVEAVAHDPDPSFFDHVQSTFFHGLEGAMSVSDILSASHSSAVGLLGSLLDSHQQGIHSSSHEPTIDHPDEGANLHVHDHDHNHDDLDHQDYWDDADPSDGDSNA